MRTITCIVIHHSVSPRDQDIAVSAASFSRNHKERLGGRSTILLPQSVWKKQNVPENSYVAYHYIINGKGDLLQTRNEWEVGYHASDLGINNSSIGVCLTGYFDKEKPTGAQWGRLERLVRELLARYPKTRGRIYPHRMFAKKTCPGTNITDDMIQGLENYDMPDAGLSSDWAKLQWEFAQKNGYITKGDPHGLLTHEAALIILNRCNPLSLSAEARTLLYRLLETKDIEEIHEILTNSKLLQQDGGALTRERYIVALLRAEMLTPLL
jgi:hypothetical protein